MDKKEKTIPRILYKFRGDSERTEEIITGGNVWLAVAAMLNDPLECRTGKISEQWKRDTIQSLEMGQIMGVVMPPPDFKPPSTLFSLSPRDTRRWFKKFKALSHFQRVAAIRKLYAEHGIELSRPDRLMTVLEEQLATVGVFSLTSRAENELMWAHYADSHAGLVLGFEAVAGSKLADAEHTLPVTYDDEKPVFAAGFHNRIDFSVDGQGKMISQQRFASSDPVFRAAISTKPSVWSYEDEWRYIEEAGGAYAWPGPLTEVVFGLRMSRDKRAHYRRLVQEKVGAGVQFFEMLVAVDSKSMFRRSC